MGMSAGGPSGGIKSDINVTPLVDVVLVLLIIFMVVTPMLQRGKSVQLPKATKVEKEGGQDSDPLILSITSDKQIFLEDDPFEEKELELELRKTLGNLPNKKILLKGDNSLTVGDVRRVMEVTRRASAKKVFLGVEEQKN